MLEFTLLLLLIIANGSPILARNLLHDRWQQPVDAGLCFVDGRPLLGPAKTWRGIVAACLLTGIAATLLGLPLVTGLLVALAAMLGDLLSSFIKRRLGLVSSSMALGLDQVPESLLPLLLIKFYGSQLLPAVQPAAISWMQVGQIIVMFFVAELLLSRILYYLHIRNRPY